jgi:cytochrome c oxidase assembly protein subunit 15
MASDRPGLRRFALITAAATLLLILAGGLVTTTGSGDTIPTWPLSWGRLAPRDSAVGAWIEQNHRYLAGVVALLVGVLAIWVRKTEERPWVRKWGYLAFGGVVAQALLGGLRIYVPAAAIAIVHAVFAQVVFGAVVALTVFLAPSWRTPGEDPGAAEARKLGVMTTAFVFLQLIAGAVTRHTGAGIAVHLVGAGLVLLHATLFSSRLMTTKLRGGGHLLIGLLAVQVVLGLSAWSITSSGAARTAAEPLSRIFTVTAHVAVGALALATCLALTLRCFRAARPAGVTASGMEPHPA